MRGYACTRCDGRWMAKLLKLFDVPNSAVVHRLTELSTDIGQLSTNSRDTCSFFACELFKNVAEFAFCTMSQAFTPRQEFPAPSVCRGAALRRHSDGSLWSCTRAGRSNGPCVRERAQSRSHPCRHPPALCTSQLAGPAQSACRASARTTSAGQLRSMRRQHLSLRARSAAFSGRRLACPRLRAARGGVERTLHEISVGDDAVQAAFQLPNVSVYVAGKHIEQLGRRSAPYVPLSPAACEACLQVGRLISTTRPA